MVHCASSSPKRNTNLTSENQVEDLYNVDLQFFFFLSLGAKNHKTNLVWLREESKSGLEWEKRRKKKKFWCGGVVVPGLGVGGLVAAGPPRPAVVPPVPPLPAVPPLPTVPPPAPAVPPGPPWAHAPSPGTGEGPVPLSVRAEEPAPDGGGGRTLPGAAAAEAGDVPLSLPAVVPPALPLLAPRLTLH